MFCFVFLEVGIVVEYFSIPKSKARLFFKFRVFRVGKIINYNWLISLEHTVVDRLIILMCAKTISNKSEGSFNFAILSRIDTIGYIFSINSNITYE